MPFQKWLPSPVKGYLLLYFEDGAYEIISSNHTLLPSGYDYGSSSVRDEIRMKPGFKAIILAKSERKDDLRLYERRLSQKLDNEKPKFDDSFGFMEKSTNLSQATSEESTDMSLTASDENPKQTPEEDSDDTVILSCTEQEKTDNEDHSTSFLDISQTTAKHDLKTLSVLKQNAILMKKQLQTQNEILKQLKSIKRLMKGKGEMKMREDVEAVIYEGTNLATIGHRNMDPSQFGVQLARHLFSDDELTSNMLFPKRSSGRPALSPTRSEKFYEAVKSRFREEEAVAEAARSANSLGNDLKKGKRKRKCDH